MDLTNTYLGFTDNMKPMQRARAEKLLDDRKRYNGTILTNKQFIVNHIMDGCIPRFKDDISYYSKKTNEYTKPKTEYYLYTKDDTRWTIEKTLYNFAVYLIAKELINEITIKAFIKYEQEQKEIEQQKLEQEKLAQEKAKKDQEEKMIEFHSWVTEQIKQYNNNSKMILMQNIWEDEIGNFNGDMIKLLIYIDNIDNFKYGNLCRECLVNWLHSGNKTSKKVFYHVTGIKLPTTNKGTIEILNNIITSQYKDTVPYKKRQKHEKDIQTFYKYIRQPYPHFEACQAEVFNKYGLEMFITTDDEICIISEAKSGLSIVKGETRKAAMNNLKALINKHGLEGFNEQIKKAIELYGLSPRYKDIVQ